MIFRKKEPLSPLEKAVYTVQKKLYQWDKQRKHWKTRFYVMVVFPVFLVLVILKALKTYVRIKLWELGTRAPSPFKTEKEKAEEKKKEKEQEIHSDEG